jgi:apolipoprotein N-acyltransferase
MTGSEIVLGVLGGVMVTVGLIMLAEGVETRSWRPYWYLLGIGMVLCGLGWLAVALPHL